MADSEKKEMIYSVKLDIEATNQALAVYTRTLAEAQKVQSGMTENLKEAQELSGREATARKKSKEVLDAEVGSINALRQANKELTAERNNTNTNTEAGRKKIEELNSQLDDNNDAIKKNVDALAKQKMGIGDYSGAIDKLVPGLGATINGFKAMAVQLWALVANPVGATIAAIATALFTVYKAFTAGEDGANRLNAVMQIGAVAMEKFENILEAVGGTIIEVFSNPIESIQKFGEFLWNNVINRFKALAVIVDGITSLDFKQVANGVLQLTTGVEDVIGKVTELATEMSAAVSEAISAGNRLAALQAEIDKKDRELVVARARTNLEVIQLRKEAIAQEGAEKEATIRKAIALEEELAAAEIARQQKVVEQKKIALATTGDEKEDKMALAQAEADLLTAQASRFEATLRFEKELQGLRDETTAKIVAAEQLKRDEAKATADWNREVEEKSAAGTAAALEKDRKNREALEKKNADAKKKVDADTTTAINANLATVLGNQKINYKAGFDLFKKGALAELLTDTNKAATAAMASASQVPLIGWLLGPAAYALTYAKGIASYAVVGGITPGFARGGRALSGTRIMAHHGIPIRRDNGDDLLATVKKNEVILNEGHQAALGGPATFRKIGVPGFASSGHTGGGSPGQDIETRTAAGIVGADAMLAVVDSALRNMRPVLVMQDYEYEQSKRDQVQARAQVF
jgi:hypothetical protein